ncbi:hypothetical protein UlMin_012463 [Ulmus minor]
MDSQVSRQDDGNNGKKKNGGQNGGNNNNRGGPPLAQIPQFREYTPLTETVATVFNQIRAVTSTYHLLVKFPTVRGIGILRGDQTESREIYEAANRSAQVQGIKSSAKSRNETPTTNIPNKNRSIIKSESIKTAGVHGVNAIHLRDDVHYVNSIMIETIEEHIRNLKETFDILRRYKMKLNPSKCAFGVSSGKFMGFMVNHRGIEANPAKIQALLHMEPPRKIKEVATDCCKPFFQALRKGKDFIWTADCEQFFQDLKSYLGKPLVLSKPHEGDSLILYLTVSKGAVSSALVREEDGVQWPIYYTSKSLLDAETRYPEIEKLALALMVEARKLQPYFQAHTIIIPTKFPLKQVF